MLAAFTFSSTTAYPGWAVAVPVVGAALVIAGGVAKPAYGVESLLRLRPFQWLGLVSYSLYLWHWPVLTIAAQHSRTGTLSTAESLWWLLVSLGLAIVTYLLLENPIRHSRLLVTKRWASLVLGGCLIASSLTVATVEIHLHEQGALATPGLGSLKTSDPCPSPTKAELASLMGTGPSASRRVVARILLVGDSTACTMVPGLEAVGAPRGVQIENAAVIGCGVVSGEVAPDIVNGRNLNNDSALCQSRASAAEARALRAGRPNVVLWSSTWERSALVVGSGKHQRVLAAGSPQWYSVLQTRMQQRVRQLTASGATLVMLTQPAFVDLGNPGALTPQDQDFDRLNAFLDEFAAHTPHVRLIDLASYVCPSGPPCPQNIDGLGPRGDGAHYDSEGSLWVARWLMPQLGIPALEKPDTALPKMTMFRPKDGAVLKGTDLLIAVPSFNTGIVKVEFEVTGPVHTAIDATISSHGLRAVPWNTTSVPNGTYTLRSVAYNTAGAQSVSNSVTVRVAN